MLIATNSCDHNSETEIENVVNRILGTEIIMPSEVKDTFDRYDIDLAGADFTILSYVDSLGCLGCRMQLPLWNEFLSTIDSLSVADVRSLMVIHPKNVVAARYLIKKEGFEYPVYIDTLDLIRKENAFPNQSQLQTFLLDDKFRVLIVGNPISNPNIKELYKSIILGDRIYSDNNTVKVSTDSNVYDFGNVSFGEFKSHKFEIKNTSNDTIFIKDIRSSCPCTQANIESDFIEPYNAGFVNVTFRPDSIVGEFCNTVQISFKDCSYPLAFTVKGFVE